MCNALGIITYNDSSVYVEGMQKYRPIAAFSFLGRYRLVDFAISNMSNSGIDDIQIYVNGNPRSLIDHVGTGRHYNINSKHGHLSLVPVYTDGGTSRFTTDISCYAENIHAVMENKNDYVVIAPVNMLYKGNYEELLKLKGIGSYTAGAIASIAYQIPVPAVDGNVFRVLTRVAADDTDIMKPSFRTLLEKELREVMHEMETPGAFNQALMELGATVCVPNGAPLCEQCPWNSLCLARKEERIAELPVKTKAKARRIEKRTVLVIRDNDKVAIRKRPEKGLLAGLYELPNVEGRYSQNEIVQLVKDMHLSPIRVQKLEDTKHIFSHIEWQMEGYAVLVEEAGFDTEAEKMAENHLIFVDAEKSQENYAIPSAFAAYAKYMGIRLGNEKFLETD